MSQRDPFRPPPDDDALPIELARSPDRPPAAPAADEALPIIEPRRARRAPRPNRRTDLILWLLAFVGATTIFVIAVRQVRNLFEKVPELPALGELDRGPTWRPLAMDDAVLIHFQLKPRDASVFLDGSPAASNPLRVPRGQTRLRVSVTRAGFTAQTLDITPDKNQTIAVELAREIQKRP